MKTDFLIDAKAVRKLAEILDSTQLSEIEYEDNGRRIRVVRTLVSSTVTPVAPIIVPSSPSPLQDWSTHPGAIKSPMVGTSYLASEPGAVPFVKAGDMVVEGQTLLIIEAMKVMNLLKSPKSGKVIQVFVQDAVPVEYNEILMIIE